MFVMVLEGNGTFTVKNKSYHLHEENIIFLNCNNAYSHCSSSDNPWKIAWIHFNGCTAAALYELFEQRNPSIVISASLEPYKILFEQIKNTLKNEELNCELYASQYLSQLTTMLITASQEEHQRSARESIEKWEKIRLYLEEHFAEKITLEDLSQRFSISKYYMLREFKKQYSVTIMQYLNQCRMNHAKKLLRFTFTPGNWIDEVIIFSNDTSFAIPISFIIITPVLFYCFHFIIWFDKFQLIFS